MMMIFSATHITVVAVDVDITLLFLFSYNNTIMNRRLIETRHTTSF